MDHEAGGKPSAFSWEMVELILARIAAGETVKEITDDPRMPCYATVYRWTHVIPEFGAAWREVREERCVQAQVADALKAMAPPKRAWVAGREFHRRAPMAEPSCGRAARQLGSPPAPG